MGTHKIIPYDLVSVEHSQNHHHHHHHAKQQLQQHQIKYCCQSQRIREEQLENRHQHHHHHEQQASSHSDWRRSSNIRLYKKYSWLNVTIIILALVLPLILETNISSCSPLRTNNEQNTFNSKYFHQTFRQQQQQQQQNPNSNHHHHHNRLQRHFKPYSQDNMETNLDSSASLSIVSPLDILRQNLLLEIHRQRLRLAKTKQVESNREFLEKIG